MTFLIERCSHILVNIACTNEIETIITYSLTNYNITYNIGTIDNKCLIKQQTIYIQYTYNNMYLLGAGGKEEQRVFRNSGLRAYNAYFKINFFI